MKSSLATLALAMLLACARPADAVGQYESMDYYVQQMIVQGDADDATGIQTFREQLENLRRPEPGDPAKARPFQQQGLEHLARSNLKDALAAFRQAFIADPADPKIAGQLGLTYLRLLRFKEAERLSVYALSLAPAQSAVWLTLGEVYGQTGDALRAGGAFANAYRFAEDSASVADQLRRLATGDDADALKAGAQKALRLGQPTADRKPAPPATPAPPSPTASTAPAPGPNPAPEAATPAHADAGPAEKAAVAGSVLGSLQRGLAQLASRPGGANPAGSPPPAPNTVSPGQRIYRQGAALTCLIVTFRNGKTDNLGSGLLVSADGSVLTNNHVIDKADNLAVRCGERESTARVRKRSKEPDLALLATSLAGGEAFALNETYSQDLIGRDVFVIGNPYGLEGTFSTGVISGLREIDGVRYIQISAPVSPGNSGGPVILRDGSVIGITAMGLKVGQNLNFAIASAEIIASGLFDPARMKSRPLGRDR
jgi:S1-C subfamily serine protease